MVDRDARSALALLAALLVATTAGPALLTGPADAATTDASHRSSLAPAQVQYDDVLIAIDLQADGDAAWRLAYRVRLDDQNTTEAFEDLQTDIRENPENYTSEFRRRMVRTANSAENTTGREMAIRNVTISAEKRQIPQEYGVVTYRFLWTDFAAVEGDRIRAGAAIGGFFLDDSTTLLFTWPENYRLVRVSPRDSADVGSDRVTWTGPLEFADGEPTLVLTSAPAGTTVTTKTPDSDDAGGFPLLPTIGITLLLVLGALGFLYTRDRSFEGDGQPAASVGGDSGGGTGGTPATGDTASVAGDSEATAADAGSSEDAESDARATDDSPESPPADLLSNEEQVLDLLEANGGRMKQQQIVQQLDWTEAKTSQVIGGMREDDQVETFRIGRENVVTLPDKEL